MRQSWETMTSVSAGHIILTPTQPVGSGRPQRGSNPEPAHQESRALPTELPRPPSLENCQVESPDVARDRDKCLHSTWFEKTTTKSKLIFTELETQKECNYFFLLRIKDLLVNTSLESKHPAVRAPSGQKSTPHSEGIRMRRSPSMKLSNVTQSNISPPSWCGK